jgi:hypothetical protein
MGGGAVKSRAHSRRKVRQQPYERVMQEVSNRVEQSIRDGGLRNGCHTRDAVRFVVRRTGLPEDDVRKAIYAATDNPECPLRVIHRKGHAHIHHIGAWLPSHMRYSEFPL